MDFLAPGFLWLLLAAPLPWLWAGARRDPGHGVLRMLALALLAVALARPARISESERAHYVFLLDRSASVPVAEQVRAIEALRTARAALPSGARAVLLSWGGGDGTEALARGFDEARAIGGDSPLGAALASAARSIPDGEAGAVLLASDGAAERRDWGPAAAELSARGIPVHVLPLADDASEPRLVGIAAEGLLRQGHPARIQVTVVGGPADVVVHLRRDGADADAEDALASSEPLRVDGRTTAVLAFEPSEAGFLRVAAELEVLAGNDARPADDRLARTFAVQEPLPVLYVGSRMQGGAAALADAVGPGFRFDEADDLASAVPADYPLVLLDDRPAETVPEEFQQRLADAVARQGTGLLMSGGGASFGPGGWYQTTVSELLPVDFVQKEEKRDPSTTLVVIIDTSGSMGGNRVQLAKEVARLAIQRLLPHDKVGIVEFYGAKRWAAPIQPASNSIELERALNRLDAGGGTVILPAIEEAFYGLQNVQTRYKHVLVLTDGGVETGPFESVLRRMADKGITISTVLIGPETHSEFLVNLANWGKGRFYNVPNRFNLPEVILKQPASAKLPAYRPGMHQVDGRGSAAWWAGTDPDAVPPLAGYVETRLRPGAEVLLETREGAHPVLASWRYGLGRVSALTTEPAGPGTEPWRDWQGFGSFLAQMLSRTAADGMDPFRYALERDGGWMTLRAERRRPSTLLPSARWLGDAAGLPVARFTERAPGLFEARFAYDAARELRVAAGVAGGNGPATLLVSDAFGDRAPELQVDPFAALDLARLAGATGGRVLDTIGETADQVLTASSGAALRLREFAPLLLVLALLLFLGDVAWRRRPAFRGGPA